jgi:hypothetical protein
MLSIITAKQRPFAVSATREPVLSISLHSNGVRDAGIGLAQEATTSTPSTIKLRFVSQHFLIEQAVLVLYGIDVSPTLERSLTTTNGQTVGIGRLGAGNLRPFPVMNGSASVSIDRPGLVEGTLFDVRARRLADATTFQFPLTEISREITDVELRSGTVMIDMEAYREIVIRLRDRDGRSIRGGLVGLARSGKEGLSIDAPVDQNGEVRLLLPRGDYAVGRAGSGTFPFEITNSTDQQVLEATLPGMP